MENACFVLKPDGRKVVTTEPMEVYYKAGGLADFFISGGYAVYGSYSEFLGSDIPFFYQSNSATGSGAKVDRTPKGNGDPNSNIFRSIRNFFSGLFGGNKRPEITTFLPGATVSRVGIVEPGEVIFEGFDDSIWRRNDHGVMMIGGAGDPAGILDVGGQIMSTWKPENRYLAMGVGVLAAFAFKKPQLALAEERAGAYSVYHGLEDGVVKYVGITKRTPSVRWAEHISEGGPKSLLRYEAVEGAEGLTRRQARVWEQNLINQHGLSNLYNKINSIDPKKWTIYGVTP